MGSWQTNTCPASPRRPRRLPELRRKQCHSHHQREWQILGTSCALTVSIKGLPVKGWTRYIHPRIWHGIIRTSAEAQILLSSGDRNSQSSHVTAHTHSAVFLCCLKSLQAVSITPVWRTSSFAMPATCKSVLFVKVRAAEENGKGIQGLISGGLTETSRITVNVNKNSLRTFSVFFFKGRV